MMVREVLEELRYAEAPDAGPQLDALYRNSVRELEEALSDELGQELDRLVKPLTRDTQLSPAELRLAEAQLAGWLDGLFQGMQARALAQQLTPRRERQLPEAPPSKSSYL
jgi:hypothetical protein